jgi:hypothetical protein
MTAPGTGIPSVVRSENSDGPRLVCRVLFLTMRAGERDGVGLVRVVSVFATFHPRASGRTSGDGCNAGVEDAIACRLDVFEQRR